MEEPKNFDAELANIIAALELERGTSKTGAQVHKVITDAAPKLNIRSIVGILTGPGALTKFIESYLHDIVIRIGNQGGDVLYGIGEGVTASPNVGDTSIWKAFVSPNTVNHLILDTTTAKLTVSSSLDLDDGTHHIERLSTEEHDKIRQEFLSSLSESQRASVDALASSESAYGDFVQALRSAGLMATWGKFRRDAIAGILTQRLKEIPIAETAVSGPVTQLLTSQQALFDKSFEKPEKRTEPEQSWKTKPRAQDDARHLSSARSLAQSAIGVMSYDEIRAIHLPLGAILDAMNGQK